MMMDHRLRKRGWLVCLGITSVLCGPAVWLPEAVAEDVRSGPLKDLNGFFPFDPPESREAWQRRAAEVRRRVEVSLGLWPPPSKTPLQAVEHGLIDRGEYTVSKVYFESLPGLFVTGNLYRPKTVQGRVPGVLFAHGHWKDARLAMQEEDKLRREIATGEERFEQGGKSRFQSMCVQLARMGCVVWQWDMLGDSDAIQLPRDLTHGFARQRTDMNGMDAWGLFSPQAELRLQNVMGLQTWNAIRSLDFLLSLPEVDPERVAVTGSSGGGTQTMMLAAVDDRVKLSFPVVMVSTSMQGGCTCENASLLRIDTGNVEFAGLFAPGPQGMNTANDWTKELASKGFPELQKLYTVYGAADRLTLNRGEHFPHNYNAVTRSAFFTFLNRQFRLGFPEPVIERDYEPLGRESLTVWDAVHPAPAAGDPDFERRLLAGWAADAEKQVLAWAASPAAVDRFLQPAVATLIGRESESAGEVAWDLGAKERMKDCLVMDGVLRNTTYGEEVPVRWLYPARWSGEVVLWLGTGGRAAVRQAGDRIVEPVQKLLDAGVTVVAADLAIERFVEPSGAVDARPRQRVVDNPREFAGYTYGYNHPVFAQAVHDVLSITSYLRAGDPGGHDRPTRVSLVGLGAVGPVAVAARAVAGALLDATVAETHGFRFGTVADYRDPSFLPGAVRYLDIAGFVVAGGQRPLLLLGETAESLKPLPAGSLPEAVDMQPTVDLSGQDLAAWLQRRRSGDGR
jgi:dienelactone hydrolase